LVGNFPEGGTEREIGVFSLRATIVMVMVMVMAMAIVVVMMTMTMEEKKIGL